MPPTPAERSRFGSRLRELRGDRTLQAISTMLLRNHDLEVGTATLSAWERGDYAPKHRSIAEVLDEAMAADGELLTLLYGGEAPRQQRPSRREVDLLGELAERVAALEEAVFPNRMDRAGIGPKPRQRRASGPAATSLGADSPRRPRAARGG